MTLTSALAKLFVCASLFLLISAGCGVATETSDGGPTDTAAAAGGSAGTGAAGADEDAGAAGGQGPDGPVAAGGMGGTNAGGGGSVASGCARVAIAKASRAFGMDILNPSPTFDYNANLSALKDMGGSFQTLHLAWSSLEAAGAGMTSGAFSDPGEALRVLNTLATAQGIKLALTIRPVDIPGKTVPSDLASTRFNTAIMKTRFRKLLGFVLTRINVQNLTTIMVGNEINFYNPGADTNFWTDYGDFLADVRDYVHASHPGLKVGFTATYDGLTDATKTLALAKNSVKTMQDYAKRIDVVGVTYYPLNADFTVKPPSVVDGDFQRLVDFATTELHIQEIGYPSGAANGSSEPMQKQFYCEVFNAWDKHRNRIPQLAALRMNDTARADAESTAKTYGLAANEAFIEYLRSLGLRRYTGEDKAAFTQLKAALTARGF